MIFLRALVVHEGVPQGALQLLGFSFSATLKRIGSP